MCRALCIDDVGVGLSAEDMSALEATVDAAFPGVTRLRISNDISVLLRCHLVGVMATGSLCELGKPAELVKAEGSFLRTLRGGSRHPAAKP